MKRKSLFLVLVFLCFCVSTPAADKAAIAPPDQIHKQIGILWKDNKFEDLRSYIDELYQNHPDYVPAIIAASFVDFIYKGELLEAKDKLEKIQKVVDSKPKLWPDAFKGSLKVAIKMIEDEIEMHKKRGTSNEDLARNASPEKVRELVGEKLPFHLELISLCPNPWIPVSVKEEDPNKER